MDRAFREGEKVERRWRDGGIQSELMAPNRPGWRRGLTSGLFLPRRALAHHGVSDRRSSRCKFGRDKNVAETQSGV